MELLENGDMEAHIGLMMDMMEKLTALGEKLADHLLVAILLGSLPDSYTTLISALESRSETDLTLALVQGKLIDEHRRRKETSSLNKSDDSALRVFRDKDRSQSLGDNINEPVCYFCKKPGHFKQSCRAYIKWRDKKTKEGKNKRHASKIVLEDSHDICFCLTRQNGEMGVWYIDSGASSHMSSDKSFFNTLDMKNQGIIRMADGKSVKAEGIGSGVLHCVNNEDKVTSVKVENVLYVPTLEGNLLSVKKLAKRGLNVKFIDDYCDISKEGLVIAIGKAHSGIYTLRLLEKALKTKRDEHSAQCQHTWHRKFGHRNPMSVQELEEKQLADGIKIVDCNIREKCECCIRGKMTKTAIPKKSHSESTEILDLIHTDLCGPFPTKTPGGSRYFLTLIDDYSRYTRLFLLKEKSETKKFIKEFIEEMKNSLNKKPKIIRSDRGKEYVNKEMENYLKQEGIKVQYTAPYSPHQNGIAERKNRSLEEMLRCMLFDAKMPEKYWGEAVVTANYLQNRLPTNPIEKTPYELWYSIKPNVGNLKIFGSVAYAHIPKELRKKLDEKARKLTFVGYSEESKAYRLLDKSTNKIIISKDVEFLDGKIEKPSEDYSKPSINKYDKNITKTPETTVNIDIPTNNIISLNDNNFEGVDEHPLSEGEISIIRINSETTSEDNNDSEYEDAYDNDGEVLDSRKSTRKTKGIPPKRLGYMTTLEESEHKEPTTREEALKGKDRASWQQAMDEEMNSLKKNETWELIESPKYVNIVGCKWIYKLKFSDDGKVQKYKARLVAQGFSQKFGVDYDEVFAPVAKQTTFRLLLALAGKHNLHVHHYDAKAAFLNGHLQENVYMRQPPGYEIKSERNMVCKMKKSLYGLKQSARVWNETLDKNLKKVGLTQSTADPCVYNMLTTEGWVHVVVYVDDILIASKNLNHIKVIANYLKKHFELTDLGEIKNYLGISIIRDKNGVYCINQRNYINKLLIKERMLDARNSKVPLDPGYYRNGSGLNLLENNIRYREVIGSLLYISVNTRPDISAAVSILSQQVAKPMEKDWTEVKRTLSYLKWTKDTELRLGPDSSPELSLTGYSDANWAQDTTDRKSHSGYLFKFNDAPISWACRKQTSVSLSSTEAEYIALAEATQECIWLRRLLFQMGCKQNEPSTIYEDNQSCIKLVHNGRISNQSKHIETKYHYTRDKVQKGEVQLRYCQTGDMIADMLTKPLGPEKIKKFSIGCGLRIRR